MPINTDVYFHKTVAFRFWKQSLQFRLSQQLFSSHNIDTGTKFLLRTIVEAGHPPFKRILDVGCGYGPLGLTLKCLYRDSLLHLLDRDALAVEYTRQNAELNGLTDVAIYGSLGYDDVNRNDFNLIVANIPDHAGETVITYLIQEARYYLAPGGTVAILVVAPLENMVDKIMLDISDAEVILKRNQSRHVVFHYKFSDVITLPRLAQNSLERGVYHRNDITMHLGKLEYKMQTANGLPEFDSLSYSSEMLINALGEAGDGEINHAAVLNPGQGHVAVALWKILKPKSITLVNRDLLALRYSQRNLILNGCRPESISILHQVGLDPNFQGKIDLFIGSLRGEEGKKASLLTLDQMTANLSDKGIIILSSGSTAITRLADYIESQGLLHIKKRERRRGYSLLVMDKISGSN
ncbi:MAG: methyltransferase [Dehalococcoidales bacterium]